MANANDFLHDMIACSDPQEAAEAATGLQDWLKYGGDMPDTADEDLWRKALIRACAATRLMYDTEV